MKKYNITALIKDGNKHIAYLIESKLETCTESRMVDRNTIEELVKTNQVIFLQWEDGKIGYKLTEEEKHLLKVSKTPLNISKDMQQWWDEKLIFQLRHFDNIPNGVVVGSPTRLLEIYRESTLATCVCDFYFYGEGDRLIALYHEIADILMDMGIRINIRKYNNYMAMARVDIATLHKLLQCLKDSKVVVNAERFQRRYTEVMEIKGIAYRPLSADHSLLWRNRFVKYNENTVESKLNVTGWVDMQIREQKKWSEPNRGWRN